MTKAIDTRPASVLVVQGVFPYYRTALFSKLCEQTPPAPQYTILFGVDRRSSIAAYRGVSELPGERIPHGRALAVRNRYLCRWFTWQHAVIRSAVGRNFDVLVFEGCPYYLSTWVAAVLARITGKRVLFWTHGFRRKERGGKLWLRLAFYRLAHCMLLYGTRGRAICAEAGLRPETLFIVNNSLDYDLQVKLRESLSERDLQEWRRKLFRQEELPILVWCGRLTNERRLDMLLIAAHKLHGKQKPVNVLLIGDGQASGSLKALSQQLGGQKYTCFYGPCHNEQDICCMLSASTALVCPGPIGLSAIHAMTYGLPVITNDDFDTQGPEAQTVTPGITGDFFRSGDAADLTRHVEKWLTLTQSSSHYKKECMERMKTYTPAYQLSCFNCAVNTTKPLAARSSIENENSTLGT